MFSSFFPIFGGSVIKIYIGTSGWTYDHWRGVFYPDNLAKARWFSFYATQFNSVEINATFYRSFKDQTYIKWREKAPQGFRYVLKAPRIITHRKYLENVTGDIRNFERSASLLEDKLGLILLQLAPATPYDIQRLRTALSTFQDPQKIAVEFRHRRWLTGETFALLKEFGVTFCNPDSPRSTLTDFTTSSNGYLRLHGRKHWYTYDYSEEELHEIVDIIHRMETRGAQAIYVFFNNDFEGFAPKNASQLINIMRE
ncbi:MAG: DUF72 domain-containing protein [Anaerolineales bacterium]|nr:DUF72 domain-containing protein [Anaerolineales bacterium]